MDKKEKGEQRGLRERLLRSLDLPADTLPGGWLIEIRGREEVTVRGGGRILLYTAEHIRIALPRCVLSLRGRSLCCVAYHVDTVSVEGGIEQIGFEEERA